MSIKSIKIERRWCGWLACVDGIYGYSRESGCEAIGNALVYHSPTTVITEEPVKFKTWRLILREIYWHYKKGSRYGEL